MSTFITEGLPNDWLGVMEEVPVAEDLSFFQYRAYFAQPAPAGCTVPGVPYEVWKRTGITGGNTEELRLKIEAELSGDPL